MSSLSEVVLVDVVVMCLLAILLAFFIPPPPLHPPLALLISFLGGLVAGRSGAFMRECGGTIERGTPPVHGFPPVSPRVR